MADDDHNADYTDTEYRYNQLMAAEDEELWQQLSDPASPNFILHQPDYYCAVYPMLAPG